VEEMANIFSLRKELKAFLPEEDFVHHSMVAAKRKEPSPEESSKIVQKSQQSAQKAISSKESVEPIPAKCTKIDLCQAPLKVSFDGIIHFGCIGMAPLFKPLEQVVTLTNDTSKHYYCVFPDIIPESKSFSCCPSEHRVLVAPGETKSVTFTLKLNCTVDIQLSIPACIWEKGSKESVICFLETEIFGELSLFLNPEEIIRGKEVGHGSFGDVFQGFYRGTMVAVKNIKFLPEYSREEIISSFEKEVDVLSKLRHPAIVLFVGSSRTDDCLSILTEFSTYGSLQSVIQKYPSISLLFRVKALYDVASAMNFLHKCHIIHRDLKTENALVFSLDCNVFPITKNPIVKLADFGTSKPLGALAEKKKMEKSKLVGTPIFMAPEMIAGCADYDNTVDVYSFAVMMTQVFSGKFPFEDIYFPTMNDLAGHIIRGLRPKMPQIISRNMKDLITYGWDKDPSQRPSFTIIVQVLEAELISLQAQFTHY